jgi:hypothetical protein
LIALRLVTGQSQRSADFTRQRRPVRVKLRRTQPEQMSSQLPLKADIAHGGRHFRKAPYCDIRSFDVVKWSMAHRKDSCRRHRGRARIPVAPLPERQVPLRQRLADAETCEAEQEGSTHLFEFDRGNPPANRLADGQILFTQWLGRCPPSTNANAGSRSFIRSPRQRGKADRLAR